MNEKTKELTAVGFNINLPKNFYLYIALAIGIPMIIFAIMQFSLTRVK